MKRLHIHVAVEDLDQSVRFYSTLFGAEPTVTKSDYAKWMLEDPRVNFAISARAGNEHAAGIEHLGIQVESEAELAEVYARLKQADRPVLEEGHTTCCYAKSEKSWVQDPAGVPWEVFHTYGGHAVYGGAGEAVNPRLASTAAPVAAPAAPMAGEVKKTGGCCGPSVEAAPRSAAPAMAAAGSCCAPS